MISAAMETLRLAAEAKVLQTLDDRSRRRKHRDGRCCPLATSRSTATLANKLEALQSFNKTIGENADDATIAHFNVDAH